MGWKKTVEEAMNQMEELRGYLHDLQAAIAALNEVRTPQDCERVMELAIGIGSSALALRAVLKVPTPRRGRMYGYLPT